MTTARRTRGVSVQWGVLMQWSVCLHFKWCMPTAAFLLMTFFSKQRLRKQYKNGPLMIGGPLRRVKLTNRLRICFSSLSSSKGLKEHLQLDKSGKHRRSHAAQIVGGFTNTLLDLGVQSFRKTHHRRQIREHVDDFELTLTDVDARWMERSKSPDVRFSQSNGHSETLAKPGRRQLVRHHQRVVVCQRVNVWC